MGISSPSPRPNQEHELAARLAAIVESSTDAIFGKTLDGVVTSWNTGAAHMYGYAPAEIIGQNVTVLIPPDRRGELGPIFDRLRRGERVEPFETQRRRKDGTILDVSVCISPILDQHGTVTGASTVARDVTERNRAEAERRALEQELHRTERLDILGQLAGGIAHDFNNLLAAILNFAEFVVAGTRDRPRVQADAAQIQATADRGARLVRQLLIFSRQGDSEPELLDLNTVLEDTEPLLHTSLGGQIELRIARASRPAAVLADRGRLEQVLLNLAVNARDAMPRGGTLRVATRHVDLDQTSAQAHPGLAAGPHVELSVRDTGTGMSPEVAARIFDPFFTTKPAGQGAGLGLSTVYGIVTRAGGTIAVDTAPGTGTTFRIWFPASTLPAGPPRPGGEARGPAPAARAHGTILIVDDDPAVLAGAARILRQHGYTTIEAGSGEEALSLATTRNFQLLLTDSVMPGITGLSLASRIAAVKPGLRILRMSGTSDQRSGPGTDEADPAFIQKPFTAAHLIDKVSTALITPSGTPGAAGPPGPPGAPGGSPGAPGG